MGHLTASYLLGNVSSYGQKNISGDFDAIGFLKQLFRWLQQFMIPAIALGGLILIGYSVLKTVKNFTGDERTHTSWMRIFAMLIVGGGMLFGGLAMLQDLAGGGVKTIEDMGTGGLLLF